MNEELKQNISFNEFELDTAHRQLLREGKTVPLYAKTFDLLNFLVENSGRVLTKDEILDAVWEGQFVEESNLSVQISALRKALGEKTTAPRFLVTVPGKGYKFVADVKIVSTEIAAVKPEISDNIEEIENTVSDGGIDGQQKTLSEGVSIGHYEIIEEIGRGGMGEVYLAKDTRLNRQVALKLLAVHITEDKNRVSRFRQEGFATSALNHPNIVTIFEIGKWHNRDFITAEFIDGMTLRTLLQTKKLSIGEALDVSLQIASALAAAHNAGIVHRDIKPENIMIRYDGLVKVLDFGIAKYKPNEDGYKPLIETEVGEVIGTAAYMSPEQARGLEIDARTDVWSLGVILYEMIAGKLPFPGETKSDRIASILEHEPLPLTKNRSNVPSELEKIVNRTLAKKKEERYADIAEMAEDLNRLRGNTGEKRPIALHLPPKKSALAKYVYMFAALAAIFLTVSIATVFFTDVGKNLWQQKNAPIQQSKQRLISTFPGSHSSASFSPDGNRIAFVNDVNEIPQVWIKDLSGGEPVRITAEDEYAMRPRWSPVSNEIVYFHKGKEGTGIYRISIENGNSRKIIDGGRNPNWSRDGKKIVFEREYDIWMANKDGSEQSRVEGVPQTDLLWADRMPAFSPDGSLIAFFQNDKGPMGDYWIIPAAGGEAKRLTNDATFGGAATFSPDGESIIFPSRRGGSNTLWRVSINGGEPEAVLSSAGEDTEPQISLDADKLIYSNTRKTYTLMLTDAKSGEVREIKDSRLEIVFPDFSPDGTQIAFFGFNETGEIHIYTIGTDGKDLKQVTTGKNVMNLHPQWSEDGQTIYFYQTKPTVSFRKISAGGGESTELINNWEWGTQNHTQVSPDGKRIIYTKLDRGKPVATMIRDIETGKETAFTSTLRQMRWSHDGKFIAGADLSGGGWENAEVAICPVDGNPCRKIAKGYRPIWSPDDANIYYHSDATSDGESVWVTPLGGGDEKKIADLRPMESIGHFYAVSSQGEIAWVKFEQSKSELWMADFSLR